MLCQAAVSSVIFSNSLQWAPHIHPACIVSKGGDVQHDDPCVQAGETVGSIAESYGVDPARLAADNAVPPSGALAVGQTLVVRFPRQVHAVRAGETLASIAEAYGTTVRRLWQNNWPLGGGAALQPGQVLVISYFDEPLAPPPSTVMLPLH